MHAPLFHLRYQACPTSTRENTTLFLLLSNLAAHWFSLACFVFLKKLSGLIVDRVWEFTDENDDELKSKYVNGS
jgi:hypothetical protein